MEERLNVTNTFNYVSIDEHRIMKILVLSFFVVILGIIRGLCYLRVKRFPSPRPRPVEHELDVLDSQFNTERSEEIVGANPTRSLEVPKNSIQISKFYFVMCI